MTIHFFPTLRQIAYVKVAQGILYTLDLENLKHSKPTPGSFYRKEYIQPIEEMVSLIIIPTSAATNSCFSSVAPTKSEQNHELLPSEEQTQLVGIFVTLCLEVTDWYESHSSILRHNDLDLRNRLAWYSLGIINRLETARCFIEDESINIEERFHLACEYCFEDSMHKLWRTMSLEDKSSFKKYLPKSRNMEIWLEVLERNTKIDWRQIPLNKKTKLLHKNCLGIHYYFTKFRSHKMKCMCLLNALESRKLHRFDLYLCLFRINEDGRNKMLRYWPHLALVFLFEFFLDWPFQNIFLNVVNYFSWHITKDIFRHLLISILDFKIGNGCKDYLYTELLECFWNLASEKCRNFVKDDEKLYAIVRYVFKKSKSFDVARYEKLLRRYNAY